MVLFLNDKEASHILLLAPELLGQSLQQRLSKTNKNLYISISQNDLPRHPDIVIWYLENIESTNAIDIELKKLKKRWDPTSLILILPEYINFNSSKLLELESAGLLQSPSLEVLEESISTILNGGRIVRLKENKKDTQSTNRITLGLGQWLLISGTQQIDYDLQILEKLLDPPPTNPFVSLFLLGRKRELKQSKLLLNFIWGPPLINIQKINNTKQNLRPFTQEYQTNITLKDTSSFSIWKEVKMRLEEGIKEDIINSTNILLAIDALKPRLRKKLINSLLNQLDVVINKLQNTNEEYPEKENLWLELQLELKQQAVRSFIGNYNRIYCNGSQVIINEELSNMIELTEVDDELPPVEIILDPLLNKKPLLIGGNILTPDDPRALLHLEKLVSNWLIRTSELITSELINSSAEWPELRQYLLNPELISTRELEKLRNQLNTQIQWNNIIRKPIRLYESKRHLYTIRNGHIISFTIDESRDEELKNLGWWQQQIALLVETRDALAPQIQLLIKYIGDLMVIILTKVIGRAIGLIGKGIAQGMGRTLSKG